MQLILREDVPSLGKAGEVVEVAEGFGRNFLLPRKKAVLADRASLKRLEQEMAGIEKKRVQGRAVAEALAQRLAAITVSIEKHAGEEDKIFGSVSSAEIVKFLSHQDITIDKKMIRMKEPIRRLGEHVVEIHLHGDVVVPVKIEVKKA